MTHTLRLPAALLALAMSTPVYAADTGSLRVELSGLRNAKGLVLLCLSASPRHFPDCSADPAARTVTVPANKATGIVFANVPAGQYALSVMHDENRNAKLDTTLRIPREGFGFSRNPVVRFGAPKFAQVRIAVGAGAMTVPITMRYFL